MKKLELRMYFFVPYQLTGIQQAIQAGHAALEYARKFKNNKQFIDFADNWKTWIILNGGTTNNLNPDTFGTLNKIYTQILVYNAISKNKEIINISKFIEPDLNDALTSICFICDERVFNYEDYPDISNYIYPEFKDANSALKILMMSRKEQKENFSKEYELWEKFMGGGKNIFLRDLLKGKELA